MPRVAGVDPGTVSFDLCVLDDGVPIVEHVFESRSLSKDSRPLLDALAGVGERELALMVLVRPDEARADAGVGGVRSLLRTLASSGLPVVFGPGVIHLPTVPAYRKFNRIDLGTADKVCAAAFAIVDQARRREIAVRDTAMILLELGGAFSAALAISDGQIVDGMGGTSGPPGVRAAGALDGELAYLLGPTLTKQTLFTGGALDPDGALQTADLASLWASPAHADGWAALIEGAAKAVRGLLVSASAPHEIVISGRLARVPELVAALTASLRDIAPVVPLVPGRASSAAYGGALLADALAGGPNAPLAEVLRLRDSSGTALDHVRVAGAESISLG
jgi:predicted butyrate kinase (DUF1464 family)